MQDDRRRTISVERAILEKSAHIAGRNREAFASLLVLNVVSSPGSGKTELLRRTLEALAGRVRAGVIVGDLATDNDAARLRGTGAPVIQIQTDGYCHLEANMVAAAAQELGLDGLQLLIIENVGNLVCPSSHDLGEDLRVVLLSVTEGEDKPLKYPVLFKSSHVAIVSKTDLAGPCEFDRERALANVRAVAPQLELFEISAKTGAGMEAWTAFLQRRLAAKPGARRLDNLL
jgi:hydrogenase nickel incorporation protein HypB